MRTSHYNLYIETIFCMTLIVLEREKQQIKTNLSKMATTC